MADASVPQLKIELVNKSGLPDDRVFFGFVGGAGSELQAVNLGDGKPVPFSTYESPNWYTFGALKSGIGVTRFIGGRIYVCHNAPWTFMRPNYEPSPVNPNDPNYLKRYDKMELTYQGSQYDVADTTSIDYFSIPMELYVSKNGVPAGSVTASPADKVVTALGAITSPVGGAVISGEGGKLVRVIGPGVYPPPPGLPASPYDDFQSYLRYLRADYAPTRGGTIATIKGRFGGVGKNPTTPETKPQDYDFRATIDDALTVTLKGATTLLGEHTLVLTKVNLIGPSGIYGANPDFTIDGKSTYPLNDVYGWMIGDLLSGLNIGAVGSTVTPAGAGTPVGEMDSQQWFKLKDYFGALQPGRKGNYNQWAATMAPLSQAYNFAYSDRFAHVVATLNPAVVDTLQIVVMGDK